MSKNQETQTGTTAEQREQARAEFSQRADKTGMAAAGMAKDEILEAFPDPHTS